MKPHFNIFSSHFFAVLFGLAILSSSTTVLAKKYSTTAADNAIVQYQGPLDADDQNQILLRIELTVMNGGGSTPEMNTMAFDFVGGGNVDSLKLYTTDQDPVFNTSKFLGGFANPTDGTKLFNGNTEQDPINGIHYYWLVVDMKSTITDGVHVDAAYNTGLDAYIAGPPTFGDTDPWGFKMCGRYYTIGTGEDYTNIDSTAMAISDFTYDDDDTIFMEIMTTYINPVENNSISFQNHIGPSFIVIRPDASSTSVVTQGDPGVSTDFFTFNGAQKIVLDGRPGGVGVIEWTIRNTRTTSPGNVIHYLNDASNNTLTYVKIQGEVAAAFSGLVVYGPSVSTGNDDNTINYCYLSDIQPAGGNMPRFGIYSNGDGNANSGIQILNNYLYDIWDATDATSSTASMRLNAGADNWDIINNHFFQTVTYANGAATGKSFILIEEGGGYTITGNYLGGRQDSAAGPAYTITSVGTGENLYGIKMGATTAGDPCIISNNTIANINFTNDFASVAASFIAIRTDGSCDYTVGSLGSGNTIGASTGIGSITVTNNIGSSGLGFKGIKNSSSGSVDIDYNTVGSISLAAGLAGSTTMLIENITGAGTVNIRNNTLGSSVANNILITSNSDVYGISNSSSNGVTISDNTIQNIDHNATVTARVYGISNTAGALIASGNTLQNIATTSPRQHYVIEHSGGIGTISGNLIQSISQQATGLNSSIIGIYTNSVSDVSITNNTIGGASAGNMSIAGNSGSFGTHSNGSGSVTVSDNTIQEFDMTSTGTAAEFRGISNGAGVLTAHGNTIQFVTVSSTGGTACRGIYSYSGSSGHSIERNTIQYLILSTGATATHVHGIEMQSGSGGVKKNYITGLVSSATSTSADIIGVNIVSGSWDVYNNVVIIDNDGNTNNVNIFGIKDGSIGTTKTLQNTVKLYGAASSGVVFCSAFYRSSSSTATVKNNIFQNLRTLSFNGDFAIHTTNTGTYTFDFNFLEAPENAGRLCNINAFDQSFISWPAAVSGAGNSINDTVTLDDNGYAPPNFWGANQGDNLTGTVDFDKNSLSRDANPWMGAFEGGTGDMVYDSTTVTQTNINNVALNTTDAEVIGVTVVMKNPDNPLGVTSFTFNTSGSTDPTGDFNNATLWTTGTSSVFATTTQLGFVVAAPNGQFTINAFTHTLSAGPNYFWLTYDVSSTASINCHVIDARCDSLTVDASNRIPTFTDPAGDRVIGNFITVGTGGDFTTIQAAYNSIPTPSDNTYIIELLATYNDALETLPIVLGPKGVAGKEITIRPGAGVTGIETVGIPSAASPVFDLDNAAYVTLDGRPCGTGSSREWTIRNTNFGDDATIWFQNQTTESTLQYLIIEGEVTNIRGIISFLGSTGSSGNSDNLVYNCIISDATVGGTTAWPDLGVYTDGDIGKSNNNNSIDSCHFVNIFGAFISAGIHSQANSENWIISNNHFYQTSALANLNNGFNFIEIEEGNGFTIENNFIGGSAPFCGGAPYTVSLGSARLSGIRINSLNGNTTVLENNTIANIAYTTTNSTSGEFPLRGIAIQGDANVSVGNFSNGNTIGNMSSIDDIVLTNNAASGSMGFVGIANTSSGIVDITSNSLGGITVTGSRTAATTYLIKNDDGSTSVDGNIFGNTVSSNIRIVSNSTFLAIHNQSANGISITNNTFQNIDHDGSSALLFINNSAGSLDFIGNTIDSLKTLSSSGGIAIIQHTGATAVITDNSFSNITLEATGVVSDAMTIFSSTSSSTTISNNIIGGSGANNILDKSDHNFYAILQQGTGTFTCDSNIVQEVFMSNTGNPTFYGIKNDNGDFSAIGDTIRNITSNSTGSASRIYGIFSGSSSLVNLISQSAIQNLAIATTTASGTYATGIWTQTGNGTIEKNFISGFTNTATINSAAIVGTWEQSGAWNLYNNVILLDNGANTNDILIYGIFHNTSGGGNIHHNTISIGGTSTGSSWTSGLRRSSGAIGTDNILNNIFQNLRSGGTGVHHCINSNLVGTMNTNYNYLESSNASKLCYYNSVDYTLTGWQGAPVNAANSITGSESLDAEGKASGTFPGADYGQDLFTSTTVVDDYLSNPRDINPWVGAYEQGYIVATCSDAIQNQDETSVDCGGVCGTPTTAAAGADQNVCGVTSSTLAGNTPTTGTGSWNVFFGSSTVTTPANPTSAITGLTPGSGDSVEWVISHNSCTPSRDTVVIFADVPMVGTYTIGGSSPSYATFTAAVADLICRGVSAQVIFDVRDGTYNEQVSIGSISGVALANNIIFQSENGDSSLVTLTFAANITDRYTLQLDNTKYITFQKMTLQATNGTYGRVVYIANGSHFNKFLNNRITGVATVSTSSNMALISSPNTRDSNNVFKNNIFKNGSQGIRLLSTSIALNEAGTQIELNEFQDQYESGITLIEHDAPIIKDNIISSSSTYSGYQGIYCGNCDNDMVIAGNEIALNTQGYGIWMQVPDGTATKQGLISNNTIQIGTTGSARGLYLFAADYCRTFHNSINITSTDVLNGRALYVNNGSNINIQNNILKNSGGGYALRINTAGSVITSNYNNLYTTGTNVAMLISTNYTSVTLWNGGTGFDANSKELVPLFTSSTDLHLTPSSTVALRTGADLSAVVPLDIDGDTRASTPWMGADEKASCAIAVSITAFTDVGCTGETSGTATVTPSSGTGPYTYSWDTGPVQNTATATALTDATYNVTVSDNGGCIGTASHTVGVIDGDGDGYGVNCDCDDSDGGVNPSIAEVCDGIDNNCNTLIDEGFDTDGDGIADCFDNCPFVANAAQTNSDTDTLGNACDNCEFVDNNDQLNSDTDTLGNACDNCDFTNNNSQLNLDTDTLGDACDNCEFVDNNDQLNSDTDTLGNACDNCDFTNNNSQLNLDTDTLGDACDNCEFVDNNDQLNSDTDTLGNACDNCDFTNNNSQLNLDTDTLGDACDNCEFVDNNNQLNLDTDTLGDACDNCEFVDNNDQLNSDTDTLGNACDNCDFTNNNSQLNFDTDTLGDACDNCEFVDNNDQLNSDTDTLGNACDNCDFTNNNSQLNFDTDTLGDACDNCEFVDNNDQLNSDTDTLGDACDNCPVDNNNDQADTDSDGVGDACDNCIIDANGTQTDTDSDGVGDACDNCIIVANATQTDGDGDNIGDACDPSANFSASSTALCEGGSTNFTDLSTGGPTSWSWSFAGGSPATSTSQNPAGITYSAAGIYDVQLIAWNVNDTDTVISSGYITVNAVATVSASSNQAICEGFTAIMAGTRGGSATSSTWTTSGDGAFDNAALVGAIYTPGSSDITMGSVTLTITTDDPAGPCPAVNDVMTLTINGAPTAADAGQTQQLCEGATAATLAGNNPVVGTGTWTVITGGGAVTSPTLFNSGVTGLSNKDNVFRWTTTLGGCSSFDDVNIHVGPDTVMIDATTLTTSSFASSFSWAHTVSGADRLLLVGISAETDVVTKVKYAGDTLSLIDAATSSTGERTEIWSLVTPTLGANTIEVILSGSEDVIATGISFTGVDEAAPIGTPGTATGTSPTASVAVSSSPTGMVMDMVSSEFFSLTVGAGQTQHHNNNIFHYGGTSTETGAASNTMSWDLALGDEWSIVAVPIQTYAPPADPSADAGIDDTICVGSVVGIGGAITATGGTSPYTYAWTEAVTLDDSTLANPTANPTTTTSYAIFLADFKNCVDTDTVIVTVNPVATTFAGADQTICETSNATMAGTRGGAASSSTWSTSGDGSFDNTGLVAAVYTPGAIDIAMGSVTLTITTDDPDGAGPCVAVTDAMILTINSSPIADAGVDAALCNGGAVTIGGAPTASGGTSPYTYTWTPGGTLDDVTIANPSATPTVTTSFQLILEDINTCADTDTVVITVPSTPDTWTQKADLSGPARRHAVAFSIGDKGYVGTGINVGTYYKDFWEYDQASDTWTQKADFGGTGRYGAVGFSIGDKGYIGTGKNITANTTDFWEYDTTINAWTQKANFGGTARRLATGFGLNNKGYIGTGWSTGYETDFWEYNPSTDTWTSRLNFGGSARYRPVGFAIGDKGYIGTGFDGVFTKDFWEFDPTSNNWTQMANFGGTARDLAVGFSIGNKGYIGTGGDGANTKDFWEYNSATNTWVQKTNFGGTARWGAFAFSIGSKGYIGAGFAAIEVKDFWEYSPVYSSDISATDIACKGADDGIADLLVISGASPFTFLWSNSAVTEDLSGLTPGTYSVIITDSLGCTLNDTTLITEPASALVVDAGLDDTICSAGSVVIGGTPSTSGGTVPYAYAWDQAGTLDDSTLASPTASPTTTTSYILISSDTNLCSDTDTVVVVVSALATTTAGTDGTTCESAPHALSGGFGGSALSITWTTAGNGSFDNAALPGAVYTPGPADIVAGTVDLMITTDDPGGPCIATSDTMTLTIDSDPTTSAITGSVTVCDGDAGVAYSVTNTPGSSYAWTVPAGATVATGAGTNAIIVNWGSTSGNVSVTETNAATCLGTVVNLAVTVGALPTTSAITGSATVCDGDASVAYSVTNTLGSSYAWTVPAGATVTTGAGTNAITVNWGSTSGNVSVTETNATSCVGSVVNLAVTVDALPTTSAITGSATVCEGDAGVIYSVTNTSKSSYGWTVPAGASITSGAGTNSITVTFGNTSGNIEVTETNNALCVGSPVTLPITVNPLPTTSIITGSSSVCNNDAGVVYSVTNTGGSSYAWTVPAAANITAGAGTNSITVNFGTTSGNVEVTETNNAGCVGSPVTLAVTVSGAPAAPSAVTGTSPVCQNDNGVSYSVTNVAGVSYAWSYSGAGFSISSGSGTNAITADFSNTASSGTISVVPSTVCGTGSTRTFGVTVLNAPTTSAITGSSAVCESDAGVPYSVTNTAGSTYAWVVPTGATVATGAGTNSITVNFGTVAGNVQVTETNSAGCIGLPVTLAVAVNGVPAQPSTITGTASVCQADLGVAYSVTNVGGVSYSWTYSGAGFSIASGAGTNAITANFSTSATSGTLTVTPSTACGTGTARTFGITVNSPPTTSAITGSATVCESDAGVSYSVTNTVGSSYAWIVPTGASVTSGNGTNAITVAFGSISGNAQVTETNGAGCIGSPMTLAVTVDALPSASIAGTDQTQCSITTATLAGNSPTIGSGSWTSTGSANVTFPLLFNSGVTSLTVGTSDTLIWTISNGVCVSTIDSMVITVNPTYSNVDAPLSVCNGDSVSIYGTFELTAGTYYDSLTSVDGCDSVHSTVLTVNPTYSNVDAPLSICNGDSVSIYGSFELTAGTYYDSLISVDGCDSVHSTVLTVDPTYNNIDAPLSICNGDSVSIYGTFELTAGTYYDSLTSVDGCDSVHSTVLTVNPTYNNIDAPLSICNGDSVSIYGTFELTAGTYYDSLTSVDGCDSVHSTVLTVNPTYSNVDAPLSICNGDSVSIYGSFELTAGTYYDSLTSVDGCDSVHSTVLTVDPTYNNIDAPLSICTGDSVSIYGSFELTAGTYYDSLTSVDGCDSVHSTVLTVNPTYNNVDAPLSICTGDSVSIYGTFELTAGTYYDSLTSVDGCDSVHSTVLTVNPTYSNVDAPLSICTGDSVSIYGSFELTAGTYYDSLTSVDGCDSVHSTVLTVDPIYNNVDAPLSICTGDSVSIYGTFELTAGTYYDSLTSVDGCDSVHSTVLTVNPTYSNVDAPLSICTGDSVSIYGSFELTAGTYYDSLTSVDGCDSVHSTVLTVNPTYSNVDAPIAICIGDSISIYGLFELTTGTYYDSLTSVDGCDSVHSTVLTVDPTYNNIDAPLSICNGDSVSIYGTFELTAGTYYDSLTSVDGCDSVHSTVLTVDPTYSNVDAPLSICNGDSVSIYGSFELTAGTYYDSLTSVDGCDSVHSTVLTVDPTYNNVDAPLSICTGDSVSIYGTFELTAGTYFDSLTSVDGCDSVHSTILTVNPIYNNVDAPLSICIGDSVSIYGSFELTAGTYYDSLLSMSGCDSVHSTVLTVNPTYNNVDAPQSICAGDSVSIYGTFELTAGTYYDSLTSVDGCDSVHSTVLTVNPAYNNVDAPLFICTGDSVSIYGTFELTAGSYYDSLTSVDGCDSVHSTVLTVNPIYNNVDAPLSICTGDSVSIYGSFELTAGTYYDSLTSIDGCDSVHSTVLTINSAYTITDAPLSTCTGDSVLIYGTPQAITGIYYDSLTSVDGCDSIHSTVLTVNIVYGYVDPKDTICAGDSTMIYGSFESAPGVYYDTMTTIYGCDSVHSKVLVVLSTFTSNDTIAICAGDSSFLAGSWQSTAGSYVDTLTTAGGCDSIVTTELWVNPVYAFTDSPVAICDGDSALIYGMFESVAGTYYDSLISINGCDSIHSTLLSVDSSYSIVDAPVTICSTDSSLIYGSFESIAGIYFDSLTTSTGCDSVHSTVLTVNPSFTVSATAVICSGDSIALGGAYQTTAGIYIDTLPSINLCDSIVSTTLTVNSTISSSTAASICSGDSIMIGGAFQNTPGAYIDTLSASNGCDSIVLTTLSLNPTYLVSFDDTICSSDSIFLAGAWQNVTGTYFDTLPSVNACDSVIATALFVMPSYSSSIPQVICFGDSIMLGGTYQTTAGSYVDTMYTLFGCDSVLITTLTVNGISSTSSTLAICSGDSLFVGGAYQTTAGIYFDTLTGSSGCDSTVQTLLTINPSYTIGASVTLCSGDSVFLGGAYQTVAGTYTDTLNSLLGCDSIVNTVLSISPGVMVVISATNASCYGICDALAVAIASGGIGPHTYSWNDPALQTTTNAVGLCAGWATVQIQDSIGCSVIDSVEILEPTQVIGSSFDSLSYCKTMSDIVALGGSPAGGTWTASPGVVIAGSDSLDVDATPWTLGVPYELYYSFNGCVDTTVLEITGSIAPPDTSVCPSGSLFNLALASPANGTWSGTGITNVVTGEIDPTGLSGIIPYIYTSEGCPDTIFVDYSSLSISIIDSTSLTCSGDSSGSLLAGSLSGGIAPFIYLWNDPSGQTNLQAVGLTSGTYAFVVTDGTGCQATATASLSNPSPITGTYVDSACAGDSILFFGVYYQAGGTYQHILTAQNACDSTVTLTISSTVCGLPVANFSTPNYIICEGTCIDFSDLSIGVPIGWSWTFNGASLGSSVVQHPTNICYAIAGSYSITLVVTNSSGQDSITKLVTVNPAAIAQAGADEIINEGEAIQLFGSGGASYQWVSDPAGFSSSDQDPFVDPLLSTDYILSVVDSNTCTGTDTMRVEVLPLPGDPLHIYNIFSPNGDGNNDLWVIDGIDQYPENHIMIFNRWESEVMSFDNYNNTDVVWSGENKQGNALPSGTYFYVVDLGEGTKYTGWVEIVY